MQSRQQRRGQLSSKNIISQQSGVLQSEITKLNSKQSIVNCLDQDKSEDLYVGRKQNQNILLGLPGVPPGLQDLAELWVSQENLQTISIFVWGFIAVVLCRLIIIKIDFNHYTGGGAANPFYFSPVRSSHWGEEGEEGGDKIKPGGRGRGGNGWITLTIWRLTVQYHQHHH